MKNNQSSKTRFKIEIREKNEIWEIIKTPVWGHLDCHLDFCERIKMSSIGRSDCFINFNLHTLIHFIFVFKFRLQSSVLIQEPLFWFTACSDGNDAFGVAPPVRFFFNCFEDGKLFLIKKSEFCLLRLQNSKIRNLTFRFVMKNSLPAPTDCSLPLLRRLRRRQSMSWVKPISRTSLRVALRWWLALTMRVVCLTPRWCPCSNFFHKQKSTMRFN